MQLAGDFPQVLAGVIEIDDLKRARKMQVGKIPDPFGAVADDNFLLRATPAALMGLQVDSFAKLFGVLDGASVGGGIGIADGVARFVPRGLSEYASELDFPGVGQIFSLVSIQVRISSWNCRKAAISRSALRCAAGVGKLSVTVLPCTLQT